MATSGDFATAMDRWFHGSHGMPGINRSLRSTAMHDSIACETPPARLRRAGCAAIRADRFGPTQVKHPRIALHFTPTSAPWLNLVERWFAELTRRKLQRSTHRSGVELEQDITAWTIGWNENPRPFVWTKTADQILETLAHYCQRNNASRH